MTAVGALSASNGKDIARLQYLLSGWGDPGAIDGVDNEGNTALMLAAGKQK